MPGRVMDRAYGERKRNKGGVRAASRVRKAARGEIGLPFRKPESPTYRRGAVWVGESAELAHLHCPEHHYLSLLLSLHPIRYRPPT